MPLPLDAKYPKRMPSREIDDAARAEEAAAAEERELSD
jgi:hypothetical protein